MRQFNLRYSGEPRTVLEMVQDMPALLRQLFFTLMSNPSILIRNVFLLRFGLILVSGVVYSLVPFDIVPEAVFGVLGYVCTFAYIMIASPA